MYIVRLRLTLLSHQVRSLIIYRHITHLPHCENIDFQNFIGDWFEKDTKWYIVEVRVLMST